MSRVWIPTYILQNLLDPAVVVCRDRPSTRATTKRLARTNFVFIIVFGYFLKFFTCDWVLERVLYKGTILAWKWSCCKNCLAAKNKVEWSTDCLFRLFSIFVVKISFSFILVSTYLTTTQYSFPFFCIYRVRL